MDLATNDGKLAKIFIESHEYPLFGIRRGEQGFVSWIVRLVACPNHIVAKSHESFLRASPDACVQEESHLVSAVTSGSIRS